jgi:hypothetical protein
MQVSRPLRPGFGREKKRLVFARICLQLAQCVHRGAGSGNVLNPVPVFDFVTVIEGAVTSRSTARHSSEQVSSARRPRRSVSMSAARVGELTGNEEGSAEGGGDQA